MVNFQTQVSDQVRLCDSVHEQRTSTVLFIWTDASGYNTVQHIVVSKTLATSRYIINILRHLPLSYQEIHIMNNSVYRCVGCQKIQN